MFIPNTHLLAEETHAHRARLLREADQFKLQRLGQASRRGRINGVQRRLGGWMIALGSRLVDERPLPRPDRAQALPTAR